jgi:hypothetical protein
VDQGYSPIKYLSEGLNGVHKRLHTGVTLWAFLVSLLSLF